MHATWFEVQLNNPAAAMWIVEHQGQREGYVRAQEVMPGRWLVSIALQASVQSKGHGSWAIREAFRVLHQHYSARSVVANVLASNTIARRLFKGAGFAEKNVTTEQGLAMVEFELAWS